MKRLFDHFLILTSLIFPLVSCAINDSEKALQQMQAEDYFSTVTQAQLADAIEHGDIDAIQEALNNGANINQEGKDGVTPLFWAMVKQNFESFYFLLEAGADPNIATRDRHAPKRHTRFTSAMELAVGFEETRYLEQLIAHGGDMNTLVGDPDKSQETILYEAAFRRRLENIELLVRHGANLNHQNLSGNTALMSAVYTRSFEVALKLLELGADPMIKNRWGYDVPGKIFKSGNRGVKIGSKDHQVV